MRSNIHFGIPGAIEEFADHDVPFVTVEVRDGDSVVAFYGRNPDELRRLAELFGEAADRLTKISRPVVSWDTV